MSMLNNVIWMCFFYKKGTTSDEKGEFVISSIKSGSYTIVASFVGYKTLEQKIKIEEGKTLNLSLELFESAEMLKEIIFKREQNWSTF